MSRLMIVILLSFISHTALTQKLTHYVNPFVGTGAHGHTFPGATLPFGMVQLSPDTRIDHSWDGCSGYHYSDSTIYGFSHTHLSGTGVSDYGDIMLMPGITPLSFDNKEYSAGFKHSNETASPGYYSVKLNNGISAELTATTRTGFHRYYYPSNKPSIILDLTHRDVLLEGEINIISATTISVKRRSTAWAKDQHAYARIEFSQPFTHRFNADKTKCVFEFKLKPGTPLLVKTGFSFVDVEGARKNLQAEVPHWDFDKTRKEAEQAWEKELSKIEVSDTDTEKIKVFYTALYHAMIHPNVANDVDGRYRGRDNQIHTAEGFTYYTVFSLWDTFRSLHPLLTIIDRKRTTDFLKTFVAQYQQGGRLPVWELASNETDCMIGYHSVSVIADAVAKGIRDFDMETAFEAMQKSATWNHLGLPEYMAQGFLAIEDEHESVSKTLEYAYDDWCIAQVAAFLGNQKAYENYMTRSQGWKNLLCPETRLMRPRQNGGWLTPFDPKEVNNHFTEGNSWQYSFFVPQDVYGMIELMGGNQRFELLLDELFTTESATTGRQQVDITGLIGQYAHGNEPSHHMAYLYHFIGKPHKSAERIHQILREFYTSKPDGLIGNEDCGQMSAWYILSALGLYQVSPGTNYFLLSSPFLQKAIIHLENGKTFSIEAPDVNRENKFTAEILLNGVKPENESTITYQTLMEGGWLRFKLQKQIPTHISSHIPPRETTNKPIVPVPYLHATKRAFRDTIHLSMFPLHSNYSIHFTLDGTEPTPQSSLYTKHLVLDKTTTVKAIGADKDGHRSKVVSARFYRKPGTMNINILSKYSSQYTAGGDEGLIDGIRGDKNWRKGDWQGYQDQDFEVILDLKSERPLQKISAGFLQDTRAWIVFPTKAELFVSTDGENFSPLGVIENTTDIKDLNVQVQEFTYEVKAQVTARYIKIRAINYGTLPEWHYGAGGKAFIFIDEITVE